jgi:adenosylmethionine-8-amino-7-oxononanoate aminotransferase
MQEGLMCYAMGGTIDGKAGDHIMFAPPFIVNKNNIDEALDKFTKALAGVFGK